MLTETQPETDQMVHPRALAFIVKRYPCLAHCELLVLAILKAHDDWREERQDQDLPTRLEDILREPELRIVEQDSLVDPAIWLRVAKNVIRCRVNHKPYLTQSELARRAHIDRLTLRHIESGLKVRVGKLAAVAEALGVSLNSLFGGEKSD